MDDQSSEKDCGEDAPKIAEDTGPSQQQEGEPLRQMEAESLQPEIPPFKSSFVFVDSSVEAIRSREAVRVHAMRESHRMRRFERGEVLNSRQAGELRVWDSAGSSQQSALTTAAGDQSAVERRSRSRQPAAGSIALLGAGRRDPFAQYPILQMRHVDILVDYYVTEMANHSDELLDLYRGDPVSFHALLALVAMYRANKQGLSGIADPAEIEGQALVMLRTRMEEERGVHRNGTILAIALMANLEECRENNADARVHWNALKEMLQESGGLQSVWENRKLHSELLRLDMSFCTAGVSSLQHPFTASLHGSLPLSALPENEADGSMQVLPDGTTLREAWEIMNASDEFLEFFSTLRMRAERSEPSPAPSSAVFRFPPLLAEIMRGPSRRHQDSLERRIRPCTQMTSLLHMAAAAIDYQNDQAAADIFVEQLQSELRRRVALHYVYVEEVLYVLFQEFGDNPDPHRIWLVDRLMGIAKRLSQKAWKQVTRELLNFLDLPEETVEGDDDGTRFQENELQRELYGELYTLQETLRDH